MTGRDLLDPQLLLAAHRARRPAWMPAYERAVGHVLRRILGGEPVLEGVVLDRPSRLRLAVADDVKDGYAHLRHRLSGPDDPGTGPVDVQAILLPCTVRSDADWPMQQFVHASWTELDAPDALLCSLVLAPVLGDLAYVLRLRSGEGPKTLKNRAERLARSRGTQLALGLDPSFADALLEPELVREEVIERRRALVHSWAAGPDNVGELALALLCGRLAQMYYAKARRDGTVLRERVMTSRTQPLLDATLRDWEALLAYLGEQPVTTDVAPVATPVVALPTLPPPEVAERLDVLHAWWREYDARHRAQEPGTPSLWGLVPERWEMTPLEDEETDDDRHRPRYRELLSGDLVAQIEELWGWTVFARHPQVLIRTLHPFGVFAEVLEPAISLWEDLALTTWFLCFGPYSRRGLDELRAHHDDKREALAGLGAAVPDAIYDELMVVAAQHPWVIRGVGGVGAVITISIDLGSLDDEFESFKLSDDDEDGGRDPEAAFRALRAVVDRHRGRWIEGSLDALLDRLWRQDARTAAEAYWQRLRGRGGKAPTIKQALPDVHGPAVRWFGADHGALARAVGLTGPVTESPARTTRRLPADPDRLRADVTRALLDRATGIEDLRWEQYRAAELARRAADVALTTWQATGELPQPKALLAAGAEWITRRLLDHDIDEARALLHAELSEAIVHRRNQGPARD